MTDGDPVARPCDQPAPGVAATTSAEAFETAFDRPLTGSAVTTTTADNSLISRTTPPQRFVVVTHVIVTVVSSPIRNSVANDTFGVVVVDSSPSIV
jgi:hypothetical protein